MMSDDRESVLAGATNSLFDRILLHLPSAQRQSSQVPQLAHFRRWLVGSSEISITVLGVRCIHSLKRRSNATLNADSHKMFHGRYSPSRAGL